MRNVIHESPPGFKRNDVILAKYSLSKYTHMVLNLFKNIQFISVKYFIIFIWLTSLLLQFDTMNYVLCQSALSD